MPNYDGMTPGQILADTNVSDFIGEMGIAIADAQLQLDTNSINQLAVLADTTTPLGQQSLLQLGFTPSFYHYQYADLSVSMQIRMQVGKSRNIGVKFGAKYSNTEDFDQKQNTGNSSSTNTQIGGDVKISTLELKVTGAPDDGVNVDGQDIPVSGDDPEARANNLANDLMSGSGTNVELALVSAPEDSFAISLQAKAPLTQANLEKRVKTTSNSIAITGRSGDVGLIKITDNAQTNYVFKSTSSAQVSVNPASDLATFAADSLTAISGLSGYNAIKFDIGSAPLYEYHFETGQSELKKFQLASTPYNDDFTKDLKVLADLLSKTSIKLQIEGYTDRQKFTGRTDQKSKDLNVELGEKRAKTVKAFLVKNGMPASNIETSSSGSQAADSASGQNDDNVDFRKVSIRVKDGAGHWILVEGDVTEADLAPNLLPSSTSTDPNGFIAISIGDGLGLLDSKVTIDTHELTFHGGSGVTANDVAARLSQDINSGSFGFKSSVTGNVVTLYKNDSSFTIKVASDGSATINLTGKGTVNISHNTSSKQSSSDIKTTETKKAFAIGGSVDVRFARKFDLTVTGNSSIRARLVAVPAPPQFLETIQDYINDLEIDPALTPPDLPPNLPE